MSLFDNFTKPMSELFRISAVGYQVKSKMKPTPLTCHEVMEWLFRDPTTFPLARGKRVPPEFVSDFVIDDGRFECLVNGKRQWVKWSDIFDIDVRNPNEILVLAGFDSEFDSSLPMWDENDRVKLDQEVQGVSSNPSWYHPWQTNKWEITFPNPIHNSNPYWTIVFNQMIQNLKSHVRKGVKVKFDGGIVGDGFNPYTRTLGFKISIKSINDQPCHWIDVTKVAAEMMMPKFWKPKFVNPSIGILCEINKDHEENIDITYSER